MGFTKSLPRIVAPNGASAFCAPASVARANSRRAGIQARSEGAATQCLRAANTAFGYGARPREPL